MSPLRTYILLSLLISGFLICAGCTQSAPATTQATPSAGTATMTQSAEAQKLVKLETNMGTITIALAPDMPVTAGNFESLVKKGYYDGVIFHRVINGFMIQGGDPDSKTAKPGQALGSGGEKYTVDAEFNPALIHKKGALAAARTENPTKASSSCQFYIVQGQKVDPARLTDHGGVPYTDAQKEIYKTVGGTPFLDMSYTVFGQITEGLDVIDKIATQPKDRNDRPLKDIKMTVTIL